MDDVIDRRTRLIYASLADHELARQLEEAHLAAQRGPSRPHAAYSGPGRHRALGTRPWVSVEPVEHDALQDADVRSSREGAHVIDLTEPTHVTTVDVTAPAVRVVVGRQRPSEWATDDPSYYLG
jgi:hypothetical protein